VSLSQTEKVPAPAALDGVVVSDITTRSLGVRLPETASGYQRLWWKQAHQQLKAAVEDGWSRHPYVWASTLVLIVLCMCSLPISRCCR